MSAESTRALAHGQIQNVTKKHLPCTYFPHRWGKNTFNRNGKSLEGGYYFDQHQVLSPSVVLGWLTL